MGKGGQGSGLNKPLQCTQSVQQISGLNCKVMLVSGRNWTHSLTVEILLSLDLPPLNLKLSFGEGFFSFMKLTRWGLSHFYCLYRSPCLLPWLLPAVPPHLRNLRAPPLPQSCALPSGSVRCSRCSCELARLCASLFPVFVSALGSWPCLQRLPLSPRNILRKASEENETDLLPECWTWLGRCWARSLSCCKRWQWVCTQRRVQDPARWPESACRETTGSGADPESCWDSADCVIWTSGPAGRERWQPKKHIGPHHRN